MPATPERDAGGGIGTGRTAAEAASLGWPPHLVSVRYRTSFFVSMEFIGQVDGSLALSSFLSPRRDGGRSSHVYYGARASGTIVLRLVRPTEDVRESLAHVWPAQRRSIATCPFKDARESPTNNGQEPGRRARKARSRPLPSLIRHDSKIRRFARLSGPASEAESAGYVSPTNSDEVRWPLARQRLPCIALARAISSARFTCSHFRDSAPQQFQRALQCSATSSMSSCRRWPISP